MSNWEIYFLGCLVAFCLYSFELSYRKDRYGKYDLMTKSIAAIIYSPMSWLFVLGYISGTAGEILRKRKK